jgi:hypothetical protein
MCNSMMYILIMIIAIVLTRPSFGSKILLRSQVSSVGPVLVVFIFVSVVLMFVRAEV